MANRSRQSHSRAIPDSRTWQYMASVLPGQLCVMHFASCRCRRILLPCCFFPSASPPPPAFVRFERKGAGTLAEDHVLSLGVSLPIAAVRIVVAFGPHGRGRCMDRRVGVLAITGCLHRLSCSAVAIVCRAVVRSGCRWYPYRLGFGLCAADHRVYGGALTVVRLTRIQDVPWPRCARMSRSGRVRWRYSSITNRRAGLVLEPTGKA